MAMESKSKPSARSRLFLALRIVTSFLLLGVLLWRLNWGMFVQLARRSDWRLLIWPILCFWGGFLFSALRWQNILRDVGLPLRLKSVLMVNLEGFFWNNFLPSTIGGDGYRFVKIDRQYRSQRAGVFASVFLDRAYGYITVVGMHLLVVPFLFSLLRKQKILMGSDFAIGMGVFALAFFWKARGAWAKRLGNWMRNVRWLRGLYGRLERLMIAMAMTTRRATGLGVLYSAAFVVLNGVALWFYLQVAGETLPFMPVLYASTLAGVVGVLPLSVNGIGLTEAVLVLALAPAGASREAVLLAAFLLRGINMLMALPGGLLYLFEPWSVV